MQSQNEQTKQVLFVQMPPHLLQKFCILQPPGNTVGELGDAYVKNTLCGKKYEAQVEQQIMFVEGMEKGDNGGQSEK